MHAAMTSRAMRPEVRWRRMLSLSQDAALVVLYLFFFYVQAVHVVAGHSVSGVFFAAEQAMLVGIFLTRRRSYTTSTRPLDWVMAIGGWLPLAARPVSGEAMLPAVTGVGLQVIGLSLALICFSALGRSFGVVAANRGLKVHGPYQLVRHPIYAAHFITMAGFFVANVSAWNGVLLGALVFFQIMRIRAEERVLTETSDYAAYAQQVRWRLVPGLY